MSNSIYETSVFKEINNSLLVIYQTKLVNLSAFALLIYDYVITFGQERDLFWFRSPRTGWGTALFIVIRYFTLISMTYIVAVLFMPNDSVNLCTSLVKFQWFAGVITVMLAELTLQTRIYAMYGNSRKMLYFLGTTFAITFGVILSMIIRIVTKEYATVLRVEPSFACIPLGVPNYFSSVWIPLFVHELMLCGLAVYKGIRSIQSYSTSGRRSRFMMFLVADSVEYYFAFLAVFFSLELIWIIKGIDYIELPFGYAVVIGSIMCQRLLLKIRSRYYSQSTKEAPLEGRGIQIEVEVVKEEYPMSTFHVG